MLVEPLGEQIYENDILPWQLREKTEKMLMETYLQTHRSVQKEGRRCCRCKEALSAQEKPIEEQAVPLQPMGCTLPMHPWRCPWCSRG